MRLTLIIAQVLLTIVVNLAPCAIGKVKTNDEGQRPDAQRLASNAKQSPPDSKNSDHGACGFNFTARVLWASSVGGPGSPFVAAPILAPLLPASPHSSSSDTTEYLVISAAFHGEISVLAASTGLPLPGSRYPIHLPGATVYSSPVLHDVDADGSLDVVVVTGEGAVHAFDLIDGARLVDSFLIDPLHRVEKKWLEETLAAEDARKAVYPDLALRSFRGEREEDGEVEKSTSAVVTTLHPRVMASAVIVDLNGDGRVEEMIVPVTYTDEGKV